MSGLDLIKTIKKNINFVPFVTDFRLVFLIRNFLFFFWSWLDRYFARVTWPESADKERRFIYY